MSLGGGKYMRWRYRNRQITVKGQQWASQLLVRIGDAVKFEACRNKVLEEMIGLPENEEKYARYYFTTSKPEGECPILEPDPLPDPTLGLNTEEVAALLVCPPEDGGSTIFEGLKEESPGHFVCQWSDPFA
jgi:hypothetical protein